MASLHRQRGVAIITALLIVAIATTVSATISTRLQLDVRRTGNMIAGDQAYLYSLTAENWSQRILREDREENQIDHLDEDWAIEVPPIPVDGGYIRGKLSDLQSCFNLNSILDADADKAVARTRLERLLENLGIDKSNAQTVMDWIDNDLQTTLPDGAEDVFYMNLERPYRTANTALMSVSELRLIKGFDWGDSFSFEPKSPIGIVFDHQKVITFCQLYESLAARLAHGNRGWIMKIRNIEKEFGHGLSFAL